jgi:CheY-like chemotaxis protein
MANLFEEVILVEDSEIDVFINTRVIEQLKICDLVVALPTAESALEYLMRQENQLKNSYLIFLDIRMPKMDGFEFLEHFSKLSEELKSNVKIIILSSTIDPRDLESAAVNPHVFAFIPKPLTREKILASKLIQ